MDSDTFAIASGPLQDQALLAQVVTVNQNSTKSSPTSNELASTARSRTIAIIDRTADVSLAARDLVAARFSFGGRSPYAADFVLVNEFAQREFLQAVVKECVALGSGVIMNGDVKNKASGSTSVDDELQRLRKTDPQARVVLQESKMAVVELRARDQALFARKMEAPVLVVHTVRSLDDAIDFIGHTAKEPCLAAYHFANAASAKYLSQFVDSEVSFINHVPREILVGPAFPTTHAVDPSRRYPVSLFTKPRPAFVSPQSSNSVQLVSALTSPSNSSAKALLQEAMTPLVAMKRSEGGGVGFFEQGFLMNASLVLVTVLSISGGSAYWLIRHGPRLW